MDKRLSIGTAQFGLDYGISNSLGRINLNELNLIFNYMKEINLYEFDTAQTYGNSEDLIAKLFATTKSFCKTKVVTKFSLSKPYKLGDIESLVRISLDKLQNESLFGVLLHNFQDYQKYPELWNEMLELRSKGLIENIGFSIYKPDELNNILEDKLDINIIQFPFNVFDQRFKRYFTELFSLNILIYVRSVFMQGLVFLDPMVISEKLGIAKKHIKLLRDISNDSGFSINSICLNYALSQSLVSKVIIGVTSLEELKNNILLINEFDRSNEIFKKLEMLEIENEELDIIMAQLIDIQVKRIIKDD
jgi:aryl-alcohol dehydrogenase-like predicted oxidoreductase